MSPPRLVAVSALVAVCAASCTDQSGHCLADEEASLLQRAVHGADILGLSTTQCAVGDHVRCPGSSAMCAGDQCCPGIDGGPTFPCPSASTNVQGCGTSKKLLDCLAAPGPLPTRQHSVLANKSVYFLPVDRFARNRGQSVEQCDNDNHWCGGTLRGVIDHLDYIQGMNFDCIWITPVVYQWQGESPSGTGCMGYWAYNLYEIDPHFGTKQDLKDLTRALHDRGMCIVYDFVGNHMGPIHNKEMVREMVPFNKPKYFNQLDRGRLTFDEYTAKTSNWPPPAQAMWSQSGAQCTKGRSCNCYKCVVSKDTANLDPYAPCQGEMVFDDSSPCRRGALSPYCMPGDYACEGYNEEVTQRGWFYDLGDLNQSDPFVRRTQKEWINWFVKEYDIDILRLDTAPFMAFDFLSELQEAAGVPIIGEVTTTNLTFHASFQRNPPVPGGTPVMDGVLNFPLYYSALAGFCGKWFPFSTFNLTFLGERMEEQRAMSYEDLDTLGNFIDNHDTPRVAQACNGDLSRIHNALAWTMLARGVPIIYYGTEELYTSVRDSLWQSGYDTKSETYQLIARLNRIRKSQDFLADVRVQTTASASTLVFTRGKTMWVYMNNFNNQGEKSVDYCGAVPPSDGTVWVDAISGEPAVFRRGCFKAWDSFPKVLVPEDDYRNV